MDGDGQSCTLGVWWNLIGQEGNISRVAAGLPVNKAAKNHKSQISEDRQNKDLQDFYKASKGVGGGRT